MAVDQGRAISIHRHLARVGAFITGVVGGLFLLILLAVSFQSSRDQMLDRSTALAEVLASNLTASIVFQDPATASELLSGLHAVDEVTQARVIMPNGSEFADYLTSVDESSPLEPGKTRAECGSLAGVSTLAVDVRFSPHFMVFGDVCRLCYVAGIQCAYH